MQADAQWCLQRVPEAPVAFKGLETSDANGFGAGGMLYPAPSVVGLLAAIATHAAIVGGVRSRQAHEHEQAANKVLDPYREVLGSFTTREVEDRSKAPICPEARPANWWIVQSAPVFFMTQDQTALVLDNLLVMHPPGTPDSTLYRHAVRVVSRHLGADAPAAVWLADQGESLKSQSAALLQKSLDIGLRLAAGDPLPADAAFRSYHYYQGSAEKVERAQVVEETCEWALLKTLRATYLSVPATHADCAPAGALSVPNPPAATAPQAQITPPSR